MVGDPGASLGASAAWERGAGSWQGGVPRQARSCSAPPPRGSRPWSGAGRARA